MLNELKTPRSIGGLAPELLDAIFLEINSVCDLANFFAISRFVNRRFEVQKTVIIFRVLQNELAPVLADARFLFLFSCASPQDLGSYDWIHGMAAVYQEMLGEHGGRGEPKVENRPQSNAVPDLAELAELCRTLHKINFLVDAYIATQLRSVGDGEGNRQSTMPAAAPLSRAERLRVVRAFYRRQLISNGYALVKRPGPTLPNKDSNINNSSSQRGLRRRALFSVFKPWEMQQVDHANHFFTRLCIALTWGSEDAARDSRLSYKKTATRSITRSEYRNMFYHLDYLVRYMREHPSLTDEALRSLPLLPLLGGEHTQRRLHQHYTLIPGGEDRPVRLRRSLSTMAFDLRNQLLCLTLIWQFGHYRSLSPIERNELQPDGATFEFVRDAPDLAPFGWVDALEGRYVNWFGEVLTSTPSPRLGDEDAKVMRRINGELWRGAGFALWDQRRVEAIKQLDWLSTLPLFSVVDLWGTKHVNPTGTTNQAQIQITNDPTNHTHNPRPSSYAFCALGARHTESSLGPPNRRIYVARAASPMTPWRAGWLGVLERSKRSIWADCGWSRRREGWHVTGRHV